VVRLVLAFVATIWAFTAQAQQITAPDPPPGDVSNRIATTRWVSQNGGGGGGGGVASVTCGTGLSGGTITSTGTCAVIYGTSSNTAAVGNDSRITGAAQKASNLSDLVDPSEALANIGGVPATRSISAGTGLSGGGNLGADRTISLASISNNRILANISGTTAVPIATSVSDILDTLSATRGDLIYRGLSGWTTLSAGTTGQVLTTNGAGADPSWASTAGTVTSVAASASGGISVSGSPITSSGTLTFNTTGVLNELAGLSLNQGDILFQGASGLEKLAPGTSGQVLTTQGGSADPVWIAAPSGNVPTGGTTGQSLVKASNVDYDTEWQTLAGSGTVTGPVSSTDNAVPRWNSTSGIVLKNSGVIIDNSNNVTGIATLKLPNTGLKLEGTSAGKYLIVAPGTALTADRTLTITTGDASRTLTLSGNATISGTNTGDQTITLTGVVTGSGTGSFATSFANASISALTAVTPAADRVFYYDSASTGQLAVFTSVGRNIVGAATTADQRSNLGLAIGTDVQAFDSDLQALADNSSSGVWVRTGTGTGSVRTITAGTNITITNGSGVSGNPTIESKATTINTKTASYTLVLADAGKAIEMNVSSANTLTIPPNSSVAFPVGTFINLAQIGSGNTTITPDVGVTISSRNGLKLGGQYALATCYKRGTDVWICGGDLTP
jgi:hypothetical protein